MKMFSRAAIFLFFSITVGFSADWPQLLGPNRNGYLEDRSFKLPKNLEEIWSKDVGEGFGGAVTSEGLVYTLDRLDDEFDVIKCWELKSGKEIWQNKYKSEARFGFNGSRSAPTVYEEYVYTIGVLGHITCLNKKTGKLIWQRNLNGDWQGEAPPWGFGSSVLIYNGKCIAAPLSGKAGLVALNYKTGKTLWESTPFGSAPGYSSPVIHSLLNKKMLIQMSGDAISAVNPENGKEYWRWEGYSVKRAIPAPVKISEEKLTVFGNL
ncbi:MAG: PQQ-like beta-propeller repeat protein, partial [Lentisphaeraceae bacterium]|nr:PQQ-like beta-propeller repeat protein [Lentisphaeraceae bacterium]